MLFLQAALATIAVLVTLVGFIGFCWVYWCALASIQTALAPKIGEWRATGVALLGAFAGAVYVAAVAAMFLWSLP